MKRIVLIIFCVFLASCANTPSQSSIKIHNLQQQTPHEKFFSLVGIDGKQYKNKPILAGSHIFYIEGFEADEKDNSQVAYSLHAMRVRLEDDHQYSIRSKAQEGVLYVWLNNDTTNKRASSVSSKSQSNLKILTRDPNIEIISVKAKAPKAIDKIGKGSCQFKTMGSELNQGFEGSITDKKLPERWNKPRC